MTNPSEILTTTFSIPRASTRVATLKLSIDKLEPIDIDARKLFDAVLEGCEVIGRAIVVNLDDVSVDDDARDLAYPHGEDLGGETLGSRVHTYKDELSDGGDLCFVGTDCIELAIGKFGTPHLPKAYFGVLRLAIPSWAPRSPAIVKASTWKR